MRPVLRSPDKSGSEQVVTINAVDGDLNWDAIMFDTHSLIKESTRSGPFFVRGSRIVGEKGHTTLSR